MNFKFLVKTCLFLLSISYGALGSSNYLSSKSTSYTPITTAKKLVANHTQSIGGDTVNSPLLRGFSVNNSSSNLATSIIDNNGDLFWIQNHTKIMFDSANSIVEHSIFQFNGQVSNFQIIYSKTLNLVAWIDQVDATWALNGYNINNNKIITYQLPNVSTGFGRIAFDQKGQLWVNNQNASLAVLYVWKQPLKVFNYQAINLTWPVPIVAGNLWDYRIQSYQSQTIFWFLFPAVNSNLAVAKSLLTFKDQLGPLQSIHFLYTPPPATLYVSLAWTNYDLTNSLLIINPLTGAVYFNLNYQGQDFNTTLEATVDFGQLSSAKQPWFTFSTPIPVGIYNKQFYMTDMISNTIAYNNGINNDWNPFDFSDVGLPEPTDGYNFNFSNHNNTITCLVTEANAGANNETPGLYSVINNNPTPATTLDFKYDHTINSTLINNNYIAQSDNQNNWWIGTNSGLFRMFNNFTGVLKTLLKIKTSSTLPNSWINSNTFTSGAMIQFNIAEYNSSSRPDDNFKLNVNNITSEGAPFGKLLDQNWTGLVSFDPDKNNAANITFDISDVNHTTISVDLTLATIGAEPDIFLSNKDGSKIQRYVGVVPAKMTDINIPAVSDFAFANEAVNLKLNFTPLDKGWLQMHGTYETLNSDWKPIAGTKHIIPNSGVWLSGDKNNDFYKIVVENQEQQPHVIYLQISSQKPIVGNFWSTTRGLYFIDLAKNKKLSITNLEQMDALQLNKVISKANSQHWTLPAPHHPLPPNPHAHGGVHSLIGVISIIFGSIFGVLIIGAAVCFLYPRLKLKFLVYKRNRR